MRTAHAHPKRWAWHPKTRMTATSDNLCYLVLRTHFEELDGVTFAPLYAADEGDPVRAFADRGLAESYREELDHVARREPGPATAEGGGRLYEVVAVEGGRPPDG